MGLDEPLALRMLLPKHDHALVSGLARLRARAANLLPRLPELGRGGFCRGLSCGDLGPQFGPTPIAGVTFLLKETSEAEATPRDARLTLFFLRLRTALRARHRTRPQPRAAARGQHSIEDDSAMKHIAGAGVADPGGATGAALRCEVWPALTHKLANAPQTISDAPVIVK